MGKLRPFLKQYMTEMKYIMEIKLKERIAYAETAAPQMEKPAGFHNDRGSCGDRYYRCTLRHCHSIHF